MIAACVPGSIRVVSYGPLDSGTFPAHLGFVDYRWVFEAMDFPSKSMGNTAANQPASCARDAEDKIE